jgi:thiosulfate reductase cytochrome b subunit
MKQKNILKLNAYLALITVVLFVITGFGITQYRIVEKITFGFLTKALSFQIHAYLIYPLILFLAIHLLFSCKLYKGVRNEKSK